LPVLATDLNSSRHLRPGHHVELGCTPFSAPITHGTIFRRAFEENLLVERHSVHVGIRGPIYGQADLEDDKGFGFKTIRASDIDILGADGAIDAIIHRVEDLPVYLSVDIDVLDPAFAPGTGTPEAGGLSSRELLRVLRGLTSINLIGGDLVEVSPGYDHAEITSIAAATVIFDLITLLSRRS
jgi:agmatinase